MSDDVVPPGGSAEPPPPGTPEEPSASVIRISTDGALQEASAQQEQARVENERTASESDQSAADADQTLSDSDQTSSERDEARSDADQLTSNRDQAVADRERATGLLEGAPDEGYELSRAERLAGTMARAASSEKREATAADRIRQAARRDAGAQVRDHQAEQRDESAGERDELAEVLEREVGLPRTAATEARERAAKVRARAAADRARAAGDRERAAADRASAAEERALARAELAAAQAHARASAGQLAGGVVHNFNNLLAIVLLYAHQLLPLTAPREREDLEQIISAADRGTEITAQLLAFAGLGRSEPSAVQPSVAIRELAPTLQRLMSAGVGLDLQLDAAGPSVLLDAADFEHLVLNLVLNARDAMPEGGTVTIASRARALTEAQAAEQGVDPGGYVSVSVSDTGTGVAEDVKQRIFDPFFTTKGPGSTGLGLATVDRVVEKAGGWIELESTPGAVWRWLKRTSHTGRRANLRRSGSRCSVCASCSDRGSRPNRIG